ncbi:MAG: hypothetical protein LAQ69_46610 [Acidobacteriia bacterium]|nr:hypothetical protein [Terriglobia bacterium]
MRTLLPLLIAAALSAQPTDIDGWGKIHWGMTLDQARTAYSVTAAPAANPYWTILTLPAVTIGNLHLDASAGAKQPSDRITQVRLSMFFGLSDSAPLAGPQDFETLRTLLIQKYGSHTRTATSESYGDVIQTVTWIFPHSTITLTLLQKQSAPDIGSVEVVYSQTEPNARDVL